MQPLPPEAAERQRARRLRKANRNSRKIDPRTFLAAGFLMLLTSLAADAQPAGRVTDLYRDRWQVEIGFKRLKTLGRLDELPSAGPVLARTWLLAHLIAAVLTDDLANALLGWLMVLFCYDGEHGPPSPQGKFQQTRPGLHDARTS
jgi:hypothetical protein